MTRGCTEIHLWVMLSLYTTVQAESKACDPSSVADAPI